MSSTKVVKGSLDLREFDFEVLLSQSSSLLVTCNPRTNSAARVNDARGSGERQMPSSLWLSSSIDGSRKLQVLLQTTQQINFGAEILVDYGVDFWRAWAGHKDVMNEARERVPLLGRLLDFSWLLRGQDMGQNIGYLTLTRKYLILGNQVIGEKE